MLFIFVRCPVKWQRENSTLRGQKGMNFKSSIAIVAALCFAIVSFGCGGAANTTVNVNANRSANTTSTTSSTTTTTTNTAANAATADATGPNTGVAECDEYIKKYEACLTTIASKAPQVAPAMKSAFEEARKGYKTAASTPQGKASLGAACTQAMATAKTSTAQWCPNW